MPAGPPPTTTTSKVGADAEVVESAADEGCAWARMASANNNRTQESFFILKIFRVLDFLSPLQGFEMFMP